MPSWARVHPRIPAPGTAQKLFAQSRNLLTQFFNHLTTPGFRVPNVVPAGRSLHGAARPSSIQQRFSLPARTALSRPLQTHFLPRAPAVPRTVAQVGLGAARNFSSSRPIFQNLVENIPVAGRAFYEADWEIKMRKEREMMKNPKKLQSEETQLSQEMMKPRRRHLSSKENVPTSEAKAMEVQMDQYFTAPVVPDVTTCLLIPLAPIPTARTPLSPTISADLRLLPLSELASMHISHEMHSLRVSSLISRLDTSDVWARGVQCSTFSHGGGYGGVCTMLKVEFVGWTKAEVRGVIGESGSGWCVLEEYKGLGEARRPYSASEDDDALSDCSSLFSGVFDDLMAEEGVDPSESLFIPTLDLSSSQRPNRALPIEINPFEGSELSFDPWLDSEASSESGTSETGSWVHPAMPDNVWFGFSSLFPERVEGSACAN